MTSFDPVRTRSATPLVLLPALIVFAAAGVVQHPAVALLLLAGAALTMAGICRLADADREAAFLATLRWRAVPFFSLLLLYSALLSALTAYPLLWLIREPSLGATLAVSTEVVVALLCLWRAWPCFGLIFVWRAAYPSLHARSGFAALARCAARARQVSSRNEVFFSHGLIVALCVLLLGAGAILVAVMPLFAPTATRWTALAIYAVLIVPLSSLTIVNRCISALLIDRRRQRDRPAASNALAELRTTPPPADPLPMRTSADDWNARLLRCARAGQTDLAIAALTRGAEPNTVPAAGDRDQRSVLVLATLGKDMRLLRDLIGRGADLNRTHAGLTPLIAATRDSHHGRPEAVMTLLTNGADPACVDGAGNTPLHYAALSATPIICALLCDASAPLDAPNRDGLTALGMACAARNWTLARFLLDRGAKPEVVRAQPALLSAAGIAEDDPTGIELLLKRKAKVDAVDALGRTALMIAALQGNDLIVQALLDAGAKAAVADAHGTTALMEAARSGAQAALDAIIEHDRALDAVDANGRTALFIACQSRQSGDTIVRTLLAAGASQEIAAADGKRAVDGAAAAGRWNIVAMLDPSFPLPASVAESAAVAAIAPDSPQHLLDALRFGHWHIVEELRERAGGWAIEDLEHIHVDLAAHEPAAARLWLLDHYLQRQIASPTGARVWSALLELLPRSASACAEWQSACATCVGHDGALHRICAALPVATAPIRARLQSLALSLIECGAEIFAPGDDGRTLLAHAIAADSLPIAQELLRRGVDPNVRDRQGRTALFDALALPADSAPAAVRALIGAGANPEIAAINGETAFGIALARSDIQIRAWLNWPNWKLPQRALRNSDLAAAAACGDLAAVDKLLELGLPIDALDAQGADALMRASGGGHPLVVTRLLERGADPTRATATGATPLSAAVTARRDDVVRVLLERGVPADHRLPTGGTPLMIAAALGFPEIVARLIAHGAQVNVQDERGTCALHAAAQFAFRNNETDTARRLLEALIAHGADVNATNAAGQTPLLLLLGGRADPGTPADQHHLLALLPTFLLARADINRQDQRGVGPLHVCAMHGMLLPTRALLAAQADPLRRDVLDRTPRQVAHLLGYIDVAAELGARESSDRALSSGTA